MEISNISIKQLLAIIERQLDWGDATTWQSRDFENLNQLIFEKTKISLSPSTLRRVGGRVEYNHLPSGTTLDTLARFAGFESWREFLKQNSAKEKPTERQKPAFIKANFGRKQVMAAAFIIITGAIAFLILEKTGNRIDTEKYSFTSARLTAGIPNSVIFNYDAAASPTDSVYIQQSWDPRTRTLVDKNLHKHTSVYYEPGFFQAKLVIGGRIVKEHKLMIPTQGWLGLIEDKPVPVYLNPPDFIHKDELSLSVAVIKQKNVSMEPKPTLVKYYNVGNFAPVAINNFSFNAKIKNEYREGEAACQFAEVTLITDHAPIIIPLSVRGCVSELNLLCVYRIASGKVNDLSGFGVDFSDWAQVSCKSSGNKIQFYINEKMAWQCPMPPTQVHIVGLSFSFQGTGAVKNIDLQSGGQNIFGAF